MFTSLSLIIIITFIIIIMIIIIVIIIFILNPYPYLPVCLFRYFLLIFFGEINRLFMNDIDFSVSISFFLLPIYMCIYANNLHPLSFGNYNQLLRNIYHKILFQSTLFNEI